MNDMGLEDVKNEITEEAAAEAKTIVDEAEARKQELLDEAEQDAEQIVEQAEQDAEQEAASLRRKKLSAARMDAKKKRLAAREELLEAVYDQFRERVNDLGEEKTRELIENALERLSDDVEIGTVYTREAYKDLAREYGEFEEKDVHGVIVETADGSRQFNLRFDTVAEQVINDNQKAVSEVLFG